MSQELIIVLEIAKTVRETNSAQQKPSTLALKILDLCRQFFVDVTHKYFSVNTNYFDQKFSGPNFICIFWIIFVGLTNLSKKVTSHYD